MDPEYVYQPNEAVQAFRAVTRMGHGKDITQIVSSDKDEQLDYVYGVIFISIILLIIIVAWVILLIIMSCLGSHRVGFLSGHNFIQPENKMGKKKRFYRPIIVRIIFLFFGLLALASCALLVTNGSKQYDSTLLSFQNSTMAISEIVSETTNVSTSLILIGQEAKRVRANAIISLENFCPNIDIQQTLGVTFNVNEIINSLGELSDFVVNQATTVKNEMDELNDILISTENVLDQIASFKGTGLYIVLPIVILTTILIAGTLLACGGYTGRTLECVQTQIFLRLLMIISIIFWIIGSLFFVVALVNVDFCSGGIAPGNPDDTIFDALDRFNFQQTDPELYAILQHYILGCKFSDPFEFLQEYDIELRNAMVDISSLLLTVASVSKDELAEQCGSSVTDQILVVEQLNDLLKEVDGDVDQVLDIIDCDRINSIYVGAIHDGICSSLPYATAWFFSFLIVIGVCGMMMVTLRASWLETEFFLFEKDEEVDVDSFMKGSVVTKNDEQLTKISDADVYDVPQSINTTIEKKDDDIAIEAQTKHEIKTTQSSTSWQDAEPTASIRNVVPLPVSETSDTKQSETKT